MPQIRNIVDGIPATALSELFHWVYQALKRGGHLRPFQYLGGLLIALDGTQYFDSHSLHCEHCSSRSHKNGTVTYFHRAILPVIVAPGQTQVISLAPEFITPQDGCEKQAIISVVKSDDENHATCGTASEASTAWDTRQGWPCLSIALRIVNSLSPLVLT